METTEVAIPIAVFMAEPPHRAPMIALSPEECGYGENIDGKPAPRDNIKFGVDGRYETSSGEMAEILRKHSGNTANGGGVFFEVPVEVMRHGRALDNSNPASVPEGGLTYTQAFAKMLAIAGVPIPFCGYGRLLPEQCVKAFKTGRTIEVVRDGIMGVDEAAREISNTDAP